jgi:autotransporter-associated beta strand protein
MKLPFLPNHSQLARVKFSSRATTLFAAATALFFVGAINGAQAQTYQTWRGENTTGNLLGSGKWWNFPNESTMVFGQQEFDNNVFTTMTNNNGGTTFNTWRWVFKGGATSARTITGDALRFFDSGGSNPGIYNESSATHVFNVAVSGDGSSGDPFEIYLNSTGGLTFGSTVNNEGQSIDILGSASGAKTVTFSGIVSGSGGMFVNNANATVLFDAANTYSGQLTINAGTVRLGGSGDTFGANTQAIRIGTGASLELNSVSTTVGSVGEEGTGDGGTISLGSAVLAIGGSATTFQNSISGTGGITHSGSGTLNLYGSQSYTGTTSVSAGTIASGVAMSSTAYSITGTGTFSTSANNVIADSATITLGGGTLSFGGSDTFGAVTLSTSTSSSISVASAISATGTGIISGSGNVTKTGAGQLNFAGDNSYSGTTTVSAGSLEAQSVNALGTTANGTTVSSGAALRLWNATGITFAAEGLSLIGTGVGDTGALINAGGANTWQGNIALTGGTRIGAVTSSSLTLSGTIDLASTANTLYLGGAGNITIGNNLLNAGKTTADGALYWDGAGSLRFNQATQSALTGNINLRSGTVLLGATDALGSGALTASAGSTLTLASADNNARSIANNMTLAGNLTLGQAATGTGAVTLGGTMALGATRTITVNNNLSTISGAISGATFGLTKAGTGTLVLSSASSTYSGATTVNAGTLEFNGSNTSTTTTIATGGTLAGTGTLAAVTVQTGGRIGAGASGGIGNLSVSALTLGAGSGYNWELGNVTGTMGTNWDLLTVGASGGGTVTVSATDVSPFTIYVLGNPTGWNPATSGSWTIMNAGSLSGFAANKFTVNTSGFGGSLTTGTWAFSDSSGDLVLSYNAPITDITVIVNSGAVDQGAGAGITGGAAQFSGVGSLIKTGAGTLIMTNGANNYTGGTTISEGAISIIVNSPSGSAGALGNSSAVVNVGTSGANVATGFDFGAAVTNNRGLNIVAGSGSSGTRAITTSFASGIAEQTGNVTLGTNTALTVASGSTLLISGALEGSGGLNINGSGIAVLTGSSSSYTGPVTNASTSTLRVGNNSALGTGSLVLNGGTIAAADGDARTLANNITLGGNVTLGDATGTGNLTLNGTVALNGATRTLNVGNNTTLGGAISGAAGNGLTKSGSGTLTLSGVNTFSGPLSVNAGQVTLANSGGTAVADTVAVTVASGATLGLSSSFEEIGSLAGEGNVTLGSNLLIAGGAGTSTAFSGIMSGTGGFVKKGAGVMTLSSGNTYSGQTYIVGGTLLYNAAPGTGGTGIINIGEENSTGQASTFAIGGSGLTIGNNINVRAGDADTATIDAQNTTGTTTLNGSLTLGKNADIRAASGGLLVNGNITGNFTLGKRGTGTATLAGTTAGGTKFDLWEGELQISSASNLGNKTDGFINNKIYFDGGTLGVTGNVSLGADNGMFIGAAGGTFRVASANTLTVAGAIGNGATNVITKTGDGTLTLTSTGNSGNNRFDLLAGELQVGAVGNLGDKTGAFLGNKLFFNGGTLGVTGNITLDGENGVTLGGNGTIRVDTGNTLTLQGYINDQENTGVVLSKTGAGTLFFDKADVNDLNGTTIKVAEGTFNVWNTGLLPAGLQLGDTTTSGSFRYNNGDNAGSYSGNIAVNAGGGSIEVAQLGFTSGGAISGSGNLSKTGSGSLTLTGNSGYSGDLTVSAGTLQLNRTGGASLGSVDSITVSSTATLLISQSNQVNNSAAEVTLSGGTITRATGVSEVFGNLNVSAASFLNFGSGTAGSIEFGTYTRDTGSALLTVQNFFQGNSLVFSQNLVDLGYISASSTGSFNNGYFAFADGFNTTWNGSDTFTITAIPEPSTYVAAAGLLALFLWPVRRRLIKDAKSILGLRPAGRDRIEAYRNA